MYSTTYIAKHTIEVILTTALPKHRGSPLFHIYSTNSCTLFVPWVSQNRCLICTKTAVLNVEVENRKSHRKKKPPMHNSTDALCAFKWVFRLAVFAFLSTKLNVLGADGLMYSLM